VNVSKERRWVLLEVPELGAVGQALALGRAEREARDLVAVWVDIDPTRVRVRLRRRSSRL
jgi:hypothetical protein